MNDPKEVSVEFVFCDSQAIQKWASNLDELIYIE